VSGGLWSPARRALTTGLVATVTLVAFEALAISTVMPVAANELRGIELYGWVFSAFFLGSLIGIVVAGGLADRGGLVGPFLGGLGLFAIGLAGSGLAPSMELLVGARFIQGVGAGGIPPIAYVAIGRSLPERLRPQMFAVLSTAWVVPGLVGPAIAGIVADLAHWRWVFLGLIPILAVTGIITVAGLRRGVPAASPTIEAAEHSAARSAARRIPMAVLVAIGASVGLAGLTSPEPALLAGGSIVGLLIAVPAFRRLAPEGTLGGRPGLPAAVLLRGVLTFTFFCADAYVALALYEVRGLSLTEAGLALTAATVSWTAGAWVQARTIARLGARRLVGAGFGVVIFGVASFATVLLPEVPVGVGIVTWAVTGLGMGFAYSPLSLVVLAEAPEGGQGSATAALQLSDVLGTALGTGIGGAFVGAGERSGATSAGIAGAFVAAAVVGVGGLLLAGRLPRGREPVDRRHEAAATVTMGPSGTPPAEDAIPSPRATPTP
jgi:MFS family permease